MERASQPYGHGEARRRFVGAAAIVVSGLTGSVAAQSGAPRPIRIVVPFPPGGPTDIVARPFAALLTDALGQSVIIDNRGGAGGSIGAEAVAKAAPDGATLLMGTVGTQAINPSLYRKLPYDPAKDFAPLGLVALAPVVVVVNATGPYTTIAELVEAARRDARKIAFGSAGNGTPGHLTGQMFAKAAGVALEHVPYKGSAPALTDLLAGQTPLMFDPVQSIMSHIRAGKLRALAVSSRVRSPVLPDVPTLEEAGLKGFETTAWWALYAPAATPGVVVAKLAAEVRRIVESNAFRDGLAERGLQPATGMKQPLDEFQRDEAAKWGRAVRDANVTID